VRRSGGGKTALTKGIVSGLGRPPEGTRCTYSESSQCFHGDLYRIENFHDFETLRMEDQLSLPS
jgi:tRNA A37 threonylcarbamoyladenosine biosynthesis protein TsaE